MNFPPRWLPPPPVHNNNGGGKTAFSPAVVSIIAVLGSAFLVVSYYRIFAKLCTRWQSRRDLLDLDGQPTGMDSDANVSPITTHGLEQSLIKKIPVFAYKTGATFTADTDCPVCLGEFLDHQELRLLPKCAHAFHVACIDTWLSNHSTCPLCRAPIFPEQQMRPSGNGAAFRGDAQIPPRSESMEFTFGDGFRLGPLGHERMSSSPTLRGLLNYEDAHSIWIPSLSPDGMSREGALVIDPGEDSRRLSEVRDHEQAYMAWAASATGSWNQSNGSNPVPVDESSGVGAAGGDCRSGTYFSTPTGRQGSLTRTASCKESSHSRSRDREHKWHIPSRRPSFRKNPFSIVVRSYSMGTSRRHVHALEFLDLDEFRAGQRRSPPEFSSITPASTLSLHSNDAFTTSGRMMKPPLPPVGTQDGAGPSTQIGGDVSLPSTNPESGADPEKAEASIKSSSAGGRSKSFRSPFILKRSLSGGRSMFSFRMDHSSRGRIFSLDSPPPNS